MNLQDIANISTVFTGIGAVIAILVSIKAINENTRIVKSKNLLEINSMLQNEKYYEIWLKIRHNKAIVSWPDLDEYLGIFEICYIFIKQKNLDLSFFKKQFGVKLSNIRFHDEIFFYKLILEYKYWENLFKLMDLVHQTKQFHNLYKFLEKLEIEFSIELTSYSDSSFKEIIGNDNFEKIIKLQYEISKLEI